MAIVVIYSNKPLYSSNNHSARVASSVLLCDELREWSNTTN